MAIWLRIYSGCYKSTSGWRIEKSCDGGWKIYTPEGNVYDTLPTLREAKSVYS